MTLDDSSCVDGPHTCKECRCEFRLDQLCDHRKCFGCCDTCEAPAVEKEEESEDGGETSET